MVAHHEHAIPFDGPGYFAGHTIPGLYIGIGKARAQGPWVVSFNQHRRSDGTTVAVFKSQDDAEAFARELCDYFAISPERVTDPQGEPWHWGEPRGRS